MLTHTLKTNQQGIFIASVPTLEIKPGHLKLSNVMRNSDQDGQKGKWIVCPTIVLDLNACAKGMNHSSAV